MHRVMLSGWNPLYEIFNEQLRIVIKGKEVFREKLIPPKITQKKLEGDMFVAFEDDNKGNEALKEEAIKEALNWIIKNPSI